MELANQTELKQNRTTGTVKPGFLRKLMYYELAKQVYI
jgi:hypothetical protein